MKKVPEVKSTREVYENKFLKILVDTLVQDNSQWEYAYFVKPNQNCVGVLPVDDKGLYLVNQYRHPLREYVWQIIGGMIELGDSEIDTAKKELKEEAGMVAQGFQGIGSFVAQPGTSPEETFVYIAHDLSFIENTPSIYEIGITAKHFTFQEIDKMILAGEIKCGFTLSALLLLKMTAQTT